MKVDQLPKPKAQEEKYSMCETPYYQLQQIKKVTWNLNGMWLRYDYPLNLVSAFTMPVRRRREVD